MAAAIAWLAVILCLLFGLSRQASAAGVGGDLLGMWGVDPSGCSFYRVSHHRIGGGRTLAVYADVARSGGGCGVDFFAVTVEGGVTTVEIHKKAPAR